MIIRWRPEQHSKDVVHIRAIEMQPFGTSDFMLQLEGFDVEVWNLLDRGDFEA